MCVEWMDSPGFTPAMPATIQYDLDKSNFGESVKAVIDAAALISGSSQVLHLQ